MQLKIFLNLDLILLQYEVASLTEAKAKAATVFTPYIILDVHALCSGLHLIRKILNSEKFLFVVPMAGGADIYAV